MRRHNLHPKVFSLVDRSCAYTRVALNERDVFVKAMLLFSFVFTLFGRGRHDVFWTRSDRRKFVQHSRGLYPPTLGASINNSAKLESEWLLLRASRTRGGNPA